MNKRLKLLTSIMLLVILLASTSFAATFTGRDTLTNTEQVYNTIPVYLNGDFMKFDIPCILYGTGNDARTLVPLRLVLEKTGAKVEWNEQDYTVTVTKGDIVVVLKINDKYALVNGTKKLLPSGVPPIIFTSSDNVNRTLVPARFLIEELGMKIEYINDTREVQILTESNDIGSPVLTTDAGLVRFNMSMKFATYWRTTFVEKGKIDEDYHLYLDMFNVNPDQTINPEPMVPAGSAIKSITYKGKLDEQYHRFDFTMTQPMAIGFKYDNNSKVFATQVSNGLNSIAASADSISIGTIFKPEFKVAESGGKIILDLSNTKLALNNGDSGTVDGNKYIPKMSYSQRDGSITRIVLEQASGLTSKSFDFVSSASGIIIKKKAVQGSYSLKRIDDKKDILTFIANYSEEIKESYDKQSNTLKITVPKKSLAMTEGEVAVGDETIVKYYVDATTDANSYIITFTLTEAIKLARNSQIDKVEYVIERLINDPSKILIFIDAGHGGKDPGAISRMTKTYEKIGNLATALKLRDLLLKEGYQVAMSRTSDVYVGLYDRPALANNANATLFISIHSNSNTDPSVSGIEVLYSLDKDSTPRNSEVLALAVKNELVAATGLKDRGLVNDSRYVVVRETKMDAILVELGYLSNPSDEMKIITSDFQNKAANAIKNAVKKYIGY